MTRRQSFFAYASLLLGVITFASSFVRPTSGQQGAVRPAGEGRYSVAGAANANGVHVIVTDSNSGRTWFRYTHSSDWVDLGTPVPTK